MTQENQSTRPLALILGGSTGIGRAIALRLAKNGHDLIPVARNQTRLDSIQTELSESSDAKITTIVFDLADYAQVESLQAQLTADSRHISHLVNAAGLFSLKPFLEHTGEDFDAYHDLNRAFFLLTQTVANNMKTHGGGSILNIGSMWAKQAVKATPSSAYSMAKAGLHAMTQHLAMELADHNIRVNAISPAVVVTPIYGSFIDPTKIEETLQGFNGFHPIGRVGRPEDIAGAAELLLSDDTGWVFIQSLTCNLLVAYFVCDGRHF